VDRGHDCGVVGDRAVAAESVMAFATGRDVAMGAYDFVTAIFADLVMAGTGWRTGTWPGLTTEMWPHLAMDGDMTVFADRDNGHFCGRGPAEITWPWPWPRHDVAANGGRCIGRERGCDRSRGAPRPRTCSARVFGASMKPRKEAMCPWNPVDLLPERKNC
jgi:hypothetical protein